MPKILHRTEFGNPILRLVARTLTADEILGTEIQQLIEDMRYTLEKKQYGVGLAAPQVGYSVALAVIEIKATPSRPTRERQSLVLINPEVVTYYGRRSGEWEGCISFGGSRNFPYAKAMRYKRIRVEYFDEKGIKHVTDFDGVLAHVLQHEIDHLHGTLFVDHVKDPKTYMNINQYIKYYLKPSSKNSK